jgi:hypothetical protein
MLWIALLLAISHVSYAANTQVVATNVTTDTTTAPVFTPSGAKSFYANVVCTNGVCTQTVAIYGNPMNSNQNGLLLCTITLSGTPRAQDACPVVTANFTYTYVVTTNTTGTNATGTIYVQY